MQLNVTNCLSFLIKYKISKFVRPTNHSIMRLKTLLGLKSWVENPKIYKVL
jgi:hypothetical protein